MIHNPIQGIVRGEAVVDGDASGGIDLTLYAMTAGWGAISADSGMRASGSNSSIVVVGGAPFVQGMVGQTITFVERGPIVIKDVISDIEITAL